MKNSIAGRFIARRRHGAAFLLLVVMLLLVIASATQWLATGAVAMRKSELDRLRTISMIAAIEQAKAVIDGWDTTLRLPVNKQQDERIEISATQRPATITAVWLRRNTEIARLSRPFTPRWVASPEAEVEQESDE